MNRHRVITGLVALGLTLTVSLAAVLWPFASRSVPTVAYERNVMTEVPETYRSEEAGFAVRFKDFVTPYRIMGLFAMPEEMVEIEVMPPNRGARYALVAELGSVLPTGEAAWTWVAPREPGLYRLHVDELTTGESLTLNAFVKVPYELDDEVLNGYRIGRYEGEPLRNDPVYTPPRGFVEVTPEVENTLVSPHFTLGQFLCKQESDYPKYVLLREPLLLKLERILHELNERGTPTASLHVMSAFRTPFYNRAIGNRTSYSRHLYGDAADIFVDTEGNGYMDDLTGDGLANRADASYMASVVEEQRGEPWYEPLAGGLGIYSPAPHRGPFIHVDVRGEPVRW